MQKMSAIQDLAILRTLPVCVDLLLLRDRLGHYKNPVKKVFDLVNAEQLQPIRRGRYLNLVSDDYRGVSLQYLANTLYSPSYISLEWALNYYGLIPERVQRVTSVTTKRSWSTEIPQASFSYEHLNKNRYPFGYELREEGDISFLIATPVKALLDLVSLRMRKLKWRTQLDIHQFLHEDLRLDVDLLIELTPTESLVKLRSLYNRNSKEARLLKWFLTLIKAN